MCNIARINPLDELILIRAKDLGGPGPGDVTPKILNILSPPLSLCKYCSIFHGKCYASIKQAGVLWPELIVLKQRVLYYVFAPVRCRQSSLSLVVEWRYFACLVCQSALYVLDNIILKGGIKNLLDLSCIFLFPSFGLCSLFLLFFELSLAFLLFSSLRVALSVASACSKLPFASWRVPVLVITIGFRPVLDPLTLSVLLWVDNC